MISTKEQNDVEKFVDECIVNYSYILELHQKFVEHQKLILEKASMSLLEVCKDRDLKSQFIYKLGNQYKMMISQPSFDWKDQFYSVGIHLYNSNFNDDETASFNLYFSYIEAEGWSLKFSYFINTKFKKNAKQISKKIKDLGFNEELDDSDKEGLFLSLDLLDLSLKDFINPTAPEFSYQLEKYHKELMNCIDGKLGRLDQFVYEISLTE